jgi:hypothetical protein
MALARSFVPNPRRPAVAVGGGLGRISLVRWRARTRVTFARSFFSPLELSLARRWRARTLVLASLGPSLSLARSFLLWSLATSPLLRTGQLYGDDDKIKRGA